jgi:predicted DCC family thiol-disulfide oxidoreductase YuxK
MKPIIFYDGGCALCHRFVRWVAERDAEAVFDFAPLRRQTFSLRVPVTRQATLPDSVIALDEDGRIYQCSDAVVYVLRKLGRRRLAGFIEVLPRFVRDSLYGAVAKVRYAIFGRKQEVCPLVPEKLRGRFLD